VEILKFDELKKAKPKAIKDTTPTQAVGVTENPAKVRLIQPKLIAGVLCSNLIGDQGCCKREVQQQGG
jgi:hypothetical protein